MPFTIEISEVGPAEYPLLETLREAIFSEFGHVSRVSIADGLADKQDLLTLIAHLEGNPLGFSAGYRRSPGVYYLNYLGVLRDYRAQGFGRRMLERHEGFARARGYEQLEFSTFNHFPAMLRLGLSSGYQPIGIEQHAGTRDDLAIRFGKSLILGNPPSRASAASTGQDRISADDPAKLLEAVKSGKMIVGLVRDSHDGRLDVIVQSPRS